MQSGSGESLLTSAAPGLVLDTNVVLDWLLFGEPAVAGLAAAVTQRRVRWLASASMRAELAHVLERGLALARGAAAQSLLAVWDAHASVLPEPPPHRLRCSDADDQKFIDLAFAANARWLVSRDRAVLRLARRAAPLALAIVAPRAWQGPA